MANIFKQTINNRVVSLFAATFIAVGGIAYNLKSTAQSFPTVMPSSGTCALLMTLPIPYGVNISAQGYETGYNLIGQITFTSATTGKFSGRVVNPTFTSVNSAHIAAGSSVDLRNFDLVISALNGSTDFAGGYEFRFSGLIGTTQTGLTMVGVPANNGKTIMLVSTGSGQANNPGIGPGSGLCQV
jgi:hypothetical protein